MRDVTTQFILEIRKTIDFYRATAPIGTLSHVVLSGGACQVEGLADLLSTEVAAPVELFDPFRRVTRLRRSPAADAGGPVYAVAMGLAMRQEGDR
jgi:Tfp pilus assembly PilM family ATPase